VTDYIRTREFTPNTLLALRQLVNGIGDEISIFKLLKNVPQDRIRNFRNDMYLSQRSVATDAEIRTATDFRGRLGRFEELQEARR